MRAPQHHTGKAKHRGAALMIMLVIMVMGAAAFLVSSLSKAVLQIERDKITANALAQAKDALIGYAASVDLTNPSAASPRPGNLPCPELTTYTGTTASTCSGNALGRLPWKTLGLPDLRDGSGERLWYAVSSNFKKSTLTTCAAPGQSGCLNSDSVGTITVRNSVGNIINNGCSIYGMPDCPNPTASDAAFGTGAVAVIIAPGEVLTRQGSSTAQDRSSAGLYVAGNYLDIATVGGEDNANFTDGFSTNGFIQGQIKAHDPTTNTDYVVLNDQLIVVTQDNIMQAVQKRVAGEVKQCLSEYALNPQNNGRYPWATPQTDLTNYLDSTNKLFGRLPDDFTNTCLDSGGYASGHSGNNCSSNPTTGMKNNWTGNCNINATSGWWLNWKELVFYGLADAYKPVNPLSSPSCPSCLSVNPPSAAADKKFVVIVAGIKLPTKARTTIAEKGTLSNYLETPNSGGATAFSQGASSATFNDTVVFQ